MTDDKHRSPSTASAGSFLDRLAGAVLILVQLAIGWMMLVTLMPGAPRVVSLETEVLAMVGLLFAALILVSIVALVHTRR